MQTTECEKRAMSASLKPVAIAIASDVAAIAAAATVVAAVAAAWPSMKATTAPPHAAIMMYGVGASTPSVVSRAVARPRFSLAKRPFFPQQTIS